MTTHREFERMSREERLAALKFLADRDGIDSPLYTSLAAQHEWLLDRSNGVTQRRRLRQ
jgi:hypothetical protein